MAVVYAFDPPERFVAGTVGEPGSRTFFLQAREGARLLSVTLEKQQVEALADRVDELLDEVMTSTESVVPAITPYALDDNDPLEQPIEEAFRVGTMTLSWDPSDERVVIEVYSMVDFDDSEPGDEPDQPESADQPEPEEMLLVRLEPASARAFVSRAARVIDAGRPSCPFCGMPIDPEGHLCVRSNGFRRREPA